MCGQVSQFTTSQRPTTNGNCLVLFPMILRDLWNHRKHKYMLQATTTTTIVLWPFVQDYLGELVPEQTSTYSHLFWSAILYHLPPSTMIRSILVLFKLCAWQSFCITSLQVLFGLPLGLVPSASPNHCLLFTTHAHIITTCFAVVLRLCHVFLVFQLLIWNSVFYLNVTHSSDLHVSARWSATSFSILTGEVSLPCNILLHTQLLCSLPFKINDIFILVSSGTNSLNLFNFWPPQLRQHLHPLSTCHLKLH